jgi:F-type H+-transporting ATPase subunit epsilon
MTKQIQLSIITPDEIFWNEPVQEIILPTNNGQMGVLWNHADLITAIDIGMMRIRKQGNSWIAFALDNGFATVRNNRVTVLVNSAESKQTIAEDEARNNFTLATEALTNAPNQKARIEANLVYKRAKARYLVANN